MTMTNEEIVRRYRQAADKAADIEILADLNATNRNEIIAILEDAGEALPRKRRADKFEGKIKPLYEQGLSDAEIAERLGCVAATVRNWRKRNNLPATYRVVPKSEQTDAPHYAGLASTWWPGLLAQTVDLSWSSCVGTLLWREDISFPRMARQLTQSVPAGGRYRKGAQNERCL